MSLASWPPSNYKPDTKQQGPKNVPVLETKEQVFDELLDEFGKFLPAVYSLRQNHMLKWRSRYKKAQ